MSNLDDGMYDALVLDAESRDDGAIAIELAITAGAHKGDVVMVIATSMTTDPLSLLGLPATLFVESGSPRVVFD